MRKNPTVYVSFREFLCAFFLLLTTTVVAQEKKDSALAVPAAQSFVTNHSGVFGGKTIAYKATARELHLTNDKGEPVASMWSVAYTQ